MPVAHTRPRATPVRQPNSPTSGPGRNPKTHPDNSLSWLQSPLYPIYPAFDDVKFRLAVQFMFFLFILDQRWAMRRAGGSACSCGNNQQVRRRCVIVSGGRRSSNGTCLPPFLQIDKRCAWLDLAGYSKDVERSVLPTCASPDANTDIIER